MKKLLLILTAIAGLHTHSIFTNFNATDTFFDSTFDPTDTFFDSTFDSTFDPTDTFNEYLGLHNVGSLQEKIKQATTLFGIGLVSGALSFSGAHIIHKYTPEKWHLGTKLATLLSGSFSTYTIAKHAYKNFLLNKIVACNDHPRKSDLMWFPYLARTVHYTTKEWSNYQGKYDNSVLSTCSDSILACFPFKAIQPNKKKIKDCKKLQLTTNNDYYIPDDMMQSHYAKRSSSLTRWQNRSNAAAIGGTLGLITGGWYMYQQEQKKKQQRKKKTPATV